MVLALTSIIHHYAQLAQPVIQRVNNILPQLNISYKQLDLNYSRDVVLPNYRYLIPVKNNSNPYLINLGNADLLPTIKDEMYINYNHYSIKKSLNVWGWASASIINNDVIQSITMDESGIQTILPINADGSKRAMANFGINKEYKSKQKLIFSWNIGNYTRYDQNLFLFNNISSKQKNIVVSSWGGLP